MWWSRPNQIIKIERPKNFRGEESETPTSDALKEAARLLGIEYKEFNLGLLTTAEIILELARRCHKIA